MLFLDKCRASARAALILAIAAQSLLSACATFSDDGGFATVAAQTHARLDKEVYWPRTGAESTKNAAAVAQLLQQPLGPDQAVQVALLNNHALRASFEQLQISEADLVQAGRLPNPRFDFSHAGANGQIDIVETLSFNVLSLLSMPMVRGIEKQRFALTQSEVFLDIAHLATQTRAAYFQAVAAAQSLDYARQVSSAAETAALLAQRMLAAGNWNTLDESRQQLFYAQAERALTRSERAATAAREQLQALLGITGGKDAGAVLQLAHTLPGLPALEELPDLERTMLDNRIDLKMMRQNVDALAARLKLVHATRFVNVLDIGPTWVQQGSRDAPHERGYSLTLEVPLFDDGAARSRRADARYIEAVERFSQAAIEARSEVRRAYADYKASFELARQQRDVVLPLRTAMSQQNLLRYNGALISVFELLADTGEQIASVDDYIADLRDFWLAKSRLDAALLGSPNL